MNMEAAGLKKEVYALSMSINYLQIDGYFLFFHVDAIFRCVL